MIFTEWTRVKKRGTVTRVKRKGKRMKSKFTALKWFGATQSSEK